MAKRAGYQVIGLPNYVVWVRIIPAFQTLQYANRKQHIDTEEKPGNAA